MGRERLELSGHAVLARVAGLAYVSFVFSGHAVFTTCGCNFGLELSGHAVSANGSSSKGELSGHAADAVVVGRIRRSCR